jgi:hypothetical protein
MDEREGGGVGQEKYMNIQPANSANVKTRMRINGDCFSLEKQQEVPGQTPAFTSTCHAQFTRRGRRNLVHIENLQ